MEMNEKALNEEQLDSVAGGEEEWDEVDDRFLEMKMSNANGFKCTNCGHPFDAKECMAAYPAMKPMMMKFMEQKEFICPKCSAKVHYDFEYNYWEEQL